MTAPKVSMVMLGIIMRTILVVSVIISLVQSAWLSRASENEHARHVIHDCGQKLTNIDTVDKFEKFMGHYLEVADGETKLKRGLLNFENKQLKKCLDRKESFLDLRRLLQLRNEGVCTMNYLDQLVEYHAKYLMRDKKQISSVVGSSYDAHIFSLLAHQVVLVCKGELHERIEESQRKHDCGVVLIKTLPQIMIDGDQEEEDVDLGSARSFLNNFNRVEDFAPIVKADRAGQDAYLNVLISEASISKVEDLKRECSLREPYYSETFSPIAVLTQLGYDLNETANHNGQSKYLKCWLATAQLCQGVLRTHLQVNKDKDMATSDKRFVGIKFGKPPADVSVLNISKSVFSKRVTFEEFSPIVIEVVKRKKSIKSKLKRRAIGWVKNFLERHINIEGKQKEAIEKFITALTNEENHLSPDSAVAFAGKASKHGMTNPGKIISDDTDTFVKLATFFVNKEIGLIISSIVAIALSAVFVWFTLYAFVKFASTPHGASDSTGNFKQDWRELRDKRMKVLEDKVQRNSFMDKFKVYHSR